MNCRKLKFPTEEKAEKSRQSLLERDVKKGREPYARVYYCERCSHWHVSSQPYRAKGEPLPDGYVPLSVRDGSLTVRKLWDRNITYESVRAIKDLERSARLRKLPIGWWLKDVGWCPTIAVLDHALAKRRYIKRWKGAVA